MAELAHYDKVIDLQEWSADGLRFLVRVALAGSVPLESLLTEDEIAAAETEELPDA